MAIDVNRGLAKDSRGNLIWDTIDVVVDTDFGPFVERRLVGQPNGGCIHRLGPGGMHIYMYNDDPGVFYNERGGRVSEGIARQTGFDVDTLTKAQRRKQAMLTAQEAVNVEYAAQPNAKIIRERGEYRLVEVAQGHFAIHFIDADGTGAPLTSQALTLKAAEKLFVEMAGEEQA